ncbi:MAG: Asp-tRNA(Asn)/Glu-tRNA(Gln) amidotransferase subunit GatC [Clostridia bacterium]|jgi:aspartyl-tRNA(Asn)/glutamyl-tRNA(Gln) amidotransferase subunit C|nr:Asp-tRNA(Asn)/Glu-tRNA(Gln) amidotransferase subunit GatC [Clostridia bacterium]
MSISKDEVKHIANLSKLNLTDEELEKYTNELSDIVDMANELSNIDVEGVKPTAHILDIQNVFREDIQQPSYDRELILKNAPSKDAGCVSVPKVVE